jgi:hypothetical protein
MMQLVYLLLLYLLLCFRSLAVYFSLLSRLSSHHDSMTAHSSELAVMSDNNVSWHGRHAAAASAEARGRWH